MMRLLVLSAFVAFAAADVSHLLRGNLAPSPESTAAIIRSDYNLSPEGSYQVNVETQNGIILQEQGQQVQVGQESGNSVQGFSQHTSPEGQVIRIDFVADENGYQPASDVLPTAPPTPLHVLRALEYNAAHPEQEEPETGAKLVPTRFLTSALG